MLNLLQKEPLNFLLYFIWEKHGQNCYWFWITPNCCRGDTKMPGSTSVTCWASPQYVYSWMWKMSFGFDRSEKECSSFNAAFRVISWIMKGCGAICSNGWLGLNISLSCWSPWSLWNWMSTSFIPPYCPPSIWAAISWSISEIWCCTSSVVFTVKSKNPSEAWCLSWNLIALL